MTYEEALGFLQGLTRFGLRFGLETTRRLAADVGDPHEGMRFIHVAGTNGKGSTCAFLESVYRRAGYRVGLYTSPHLVSFRERIQVNREMIPEAEVARLAAGLRARTEGLPPDEYPTFFEAVTVMALQWFCQQRCDVVIWETGLGGRLDATNIVMPVASAITNVGMDHMLWLGNTLADIAREKAGIIKPRVPALTTAEDPGVLGVLRTAAEAVDAPFRAVGPADPEMKEIAGIRLSLAGHHQHRNAALALAVVRTLRSVLPVPEGGIMRAFEETAWPGRFEIVRRGGAKLVLDGAHNAPAFEALARTLDEVFPGTRHALVLGMLEDKDGAAAAMTLVPRASRVVIVPVRTPRGQDPHVLEQLCRGLRSAGPVNVAEDLADALNLLRDETVVVITGSLYLVGEARALDFVAPVSEQELNDWSRRS